MNESTLSPEIAKICELIGIIFAWLLIILIIVFLTLWSIRKYQEIKEHNNHGN